MSEHSYPDRDDLEPATVDEEEAQEVPFKVPDGYRVLTDEEAEKLATQLVEDARPKYEIQEIVDSAVAAGEVNSMMRNEFLWEFQQGGRPIRGLTASMISHLATSQGISEEVELRKHNDDGEYHEFEVVVSMADPIHPDGKIYRSGFSEEPKVLNGKRDRFAKQKCHTKSFRNAVLKLLPQDLIISTIYKLAKLVPADWTPNQLPPAEQPPQQATPQPQQAEPKPEKDEATRTRERAFAMYTEHKDDLPEDFWERVRQRFGVKSRATMTLQNWRQTIRMIEELLAEPEEPEPEETDGAAGAAIPF